jgi:hypothetical protein
MKYAAEMSSGAMIYILSFIKKKGSGIQKIMGGGIQRDTDGFEIAQVHFHFSKQGKWAKRQSCLCA